MFNVVIKLKYKQEIILDVKCEKCNTENRLELIERYTICGPGADVFNFTNDEWLTLRKSYNSTIENSIKRFDELTDVDHLNSINADKIAFLANLRYSNKKRFNKIPHTITDLDFYVSQESRFHKGDYMIFRCKNCNGCIQAIHYNINEGETE